MTTYDVDRRGFIELHMEEYFASLRFPQGAFRQSINVFWKQAMFQTSAFGVNIVETYPLPPRSWHEGGCCLASAEQQRETP